MLHKYTLWYEVVGGREEERGGDSRKLTWGSDFLPDR